MTGAPQVMRAIYAINKRLLSLGAQPRRIQQRSNAHAQQRFRLYAANVHRAVGPNNLLAHSFIQRSRYSSKQYEAFTALVNHTNITMRMTRIKQMQYNIVTDKYDRISYLSIF